MVDKTTRDVSRVSRLKNEIARHSNVNTWKIRIAQASKTSLFTEVDVNKDTMFGVSTSTGSDIDLSIFDAQNHGISRRHALLRPTSLELFVMDVGSTNGTMLNGLKLEPNTPYTLSDRDMITLGALDLIVTIVQHPPLPSTRHKAQLAFSDALTTLAKAITSQTELPNVLNQTLEMAMTLTDAGESAIWLIDEETSELFLEDARGIEDAHIHRMRLPITNEFVNKVLQTRKPLRTSRVVDGQPIKVKTGYIVEALLFVPLLHGDRLFGVLAAAHREPGMTFSERDEKLLASIGDFAAIAIQNARNYEKLQQADQLKGEMIQNISHEFRTPLTFIISYTQLLLESNDRLTDDQKANLEKVAQHADQLLWLVKNFVSLQTAEDIALKITELDIVQILKEFEITAQAQAAKTQVDLTFDVADDLPKALGNKMGLIQVLDNLVSNALKFTPREGKIVVKAEAMSETELRIMVKDTGIGIPEAEYERIFERFVQLDGTTRREYGGLGLGLSVCKSIVKSLGGRIWVESKVEKGSAFYFTLPVAYE